MTHRIQGIPHWCHSFGIAFLAQSLKDFVNIEADKSCHLNRQDKDSAAWFLTDPGEEAISYRKFWFNLCGFSPPSMDEIQKLFASPAELKRQMDAAEDDLLAEILADRSVRSAERQVKIRESAEREQRRREALASDPNRRVRYRPKKKGVVL
jgi:hypothetical protein